MHNRGQDIINLYIAGDAAELEKRRYYNINSSGYDVFPRMFSTALKLTSPSNYLYRTLQVDQHYFAGVAARLKIPTVEDPGPLIDLSLSEQGMALQLLGNAAYIQNELGNLYQIKGDLTKAADYFTRATQIEQGWAIPWANLCGLYALQGKFTDGIQAGRTADSLQPGINLTNNNMGLLYQMAGNLMLAEAYYRNSIDINSRFYFPYEKLGQVYTMNTKYALADSFYNEAEKRKKGFHFNGNSKYPSLNIVDLEDFLSMLSPCNPDTSQFDKNDQAAFFWWGYSQYEIRNYTKAEQLLRKVVSIDRNNPLVYHYLGKLCYDQHQWEKAAVQFKLAVSNYLDEASFKQYCDKKIVGTYPYDHHCLEDFFRGSRYKREEDLYFLAAIFDSTRHYEEAEILYRTIIQMVPDNICGYYKLWHLLETTGRFAEAEKILLGYAAIEQEQFRNSQVGGNNQFKDRSDYITDYIKEELLNLYRKAIKQFPDDGYWYYKIGILDYELAPVSRMLLRDTIIYFPVLNKERFYNQAYQNNSNTSGLDSLQLTKQPGPTGDGNKDYVTKPLKISIPGTNQVILLDEIDLETPRQDAIRYLSRAAELLQDSITLADIYFRIGNVYVMAGSKKLAIPYYSRSIQFDTANAGVRLRMIDASHAAYQNSLAKENLEYLYMQRELDFPNRLLLAEFDIHAREFAEAGLLLDEAAMMMPYPIPDIIELNGRLQLLSGQPAKALTWYNEHLARVPNDPMTQYTIGRLYAQLQEPGQAYKWLELALNNGFNFSNVLAGDAIWKFYRGTSAWNELLAKFPKMKKYAPDE